MIRAALLFLIPSLAFAVTPIDGLRLQSSANGDGYSFTNLSDVVLTNGMRLSDATGGGSLTQAVVHGQTSLLTATNSGRIVYLTVQGVVTSTPSLLALSNAVAASLQPSAAFTGDVAGVYTSLQLQAGAVVRSNIAASAVGGDEIEDASLGDDEFDDNALSQSRINGLTNALTSLQGYTSRVVAVEGYTSRVVGVEAYTARVVALEGYTNRAASALVSSVWVSADSTTNYVRRTGDAMSGSLIATPTNSFGIVGIGAVSTNGGAEYAAILSKMGGYGPVMALSRYTTNAASGGVAYGFMVVSTNADSDLQLNSYSSFLRLTGSGLVKMWDGYNDGTGSGLDADLLDGLHASSFATGTPLYVETGTGTLIAASLAGYATGTPLYVETGTGTLVAASLAGYATGTPLYVDSNYLKKTGDTMTGSLLATPTNTIGMIGIGAISTNGASEYAAINAKLGNYGPVLSIARYTTNASGGAAFGIMAVSTNADVDLQLNAYSPFVRLTGSGLVKMWDGYNDGTGSGLDADLLDGYSSSSFILNTQFQETRTNFGSVYYTTTPSNTQPGTRGDIIVNLATRKAYLYGGIDGFGTGTNWANWTLTPGAP